MRIRIIVIALCFAVNSAPAEAAELQTQTIVGQRNFFTTAPGAMAFLPHVKRAEVASRASLFWVLDDSGAYRLPKQGRYCFMVNHRKESAGRKLFAGVAMLSFLSTEQVSRVSTFRNEGWRRSRSPNYDRDNNRTKTSGLEPEELFRLHRPDVDLVDLDKALGHMWHGVVTGTSLDSWNSREYWELDRVVGRQNFRRSFVPVLEQDLHMRFDGLLLSFETTDGDRSVNPLVFCLNGASKEAVYIRYFAPDDPDFEREFFLRFR